VIGADGGSKSKWKKMLIRSVAAVVMTAVFGGLVRPPLFVVPADLLSYRLSSRSL
jgi:hypothetical protein